MTENNKKGLLTELYCELYFSKNNILLSKPITQDSRYDYIMDYNGHLYKIQCKSSTFKDDKIVFRTHMNNIRQNTTVYYSKDDVDFYYTHYDGKDYLVPFIAAGKSETTLRFESKNPNNPSIRWANDFLADVILLKIQQEEKHS